MAGYIFSTFSARTVSSPLLTHAFITFFYAVLESLMLAVAVMGIKRSKFRNSEMIAAYFALLFVCLMFAGACVYKQPLVLVFFLSIWCIYFAALSLVGFCTGKKSQSAYLAWGTVTLALFTASFAVSTVLHVSNLFKYCLQLSAFVPIIAVYRLHRTAENSVDEEKCN